MENLKFEKIGEHEAFETFKIKKESSNDFIVASIFKVKKVNKKIVQDLNKTITAFNNEAVGLYLDVSVVDSISPDILEYNVDMIKSLENTTNFRRVSICAAKFTAFAFKTLMKLKKPKVPTKVFDREDLALSYVLEL